MSDHKLILHPVDPEADLPPPVALQDGLTKLGFLASATELHGEARHLPGPRFEALVPLAHSRRAVVLGSAHEGPSRPRIADGRTLISIELRRSSGASDAIEFLGGGNVESPSCPSCAFTVEEWTEVVSAWFEDQSGYSWQCSGCHDTFRPWQLDWHGTNGFGRCAIALWHVHPGEAAPSEELMRALLEMSGTPWTFFYYQL